MSAESDQDPNVGVGRDQEGQQELEEEGEDSKYLPARPGPDLGTTLHSVLH